MQPTGIAPSLLCWGAGGVQMAWQHPCGGKPDSENCEAFLPCKRAMSLNHHGNGECARYVSQLRGLFPSLKW